MRMNQLFVWIACLFVFIFGMESGWSQDWYWVGTSSSAWSDLANWNKAEDGSGETPSSVEDLQGKTLQLRTAANMPTEQDIPELVVNALDLSTNITSFVLSGEKIRLNRFSYKQDPAAALTIDIYNDLELAANSAWSLGSKIRLNLHGTVSEYGGSRFFACNFNGTVAFYGPVLLTGGWRHNQAVAAFYGMDTFGILPSEPKPDFLTSGYGKATFNLPPDSTEYTYELGPNVGFRTTTALNVTVSPNVTVVTELPVSESNAGKGFIKEGTGTLVLGGGATISGGLAINQGLVVLGESLTTPGTKLGSSAGAIDLCGFDVLDRPLAFANSTGVNGSGSIFNSNRNRESLINGPILSVATSSLVTQFGGGGDIRHTGGIMSTNKNPLAKNGCGTLTMTGPHIGWTGNLEVKGGELVFDYADSPETRLSETASVRLHGGFTMLGNETQDVVETVAALEVNRIIGTSHNESTLHVEGRGGHETIFRAKKLQSLTTYDLNGTLNLKTGTGGEIRLQDITGSVLDGSILAPCVVWDGRSYAMLGDTADEDGYFLVQPLPDASYATAFDPEIKTEIVDLENDTMVSATEIVGSLRFRNRNGANLTLDASLSLYGGGGWSGHRGAILVTPDLGETPVVIGGASPLGAYDVNGSLYVHQYNPSAPLIIDAQVNASQSGNRVVKSGPGELILTHPDNRFGTLSIQNGTLSVTSITNSETPSAAGCGSDIFLRSATFRYLGEGDETNRRIVLGGDGTLEASGNGRLTLTGETAVAAKDGADYELTLAGTGEGEILGNISIELGRVIKRGTGTWCLAGADSIFRNGLSVEEGTLRLEGKVGRNVEVAGGATLLSAGGSILRNLVLEPEATLGYVAKSAPLQVGGRVLLNDAKVSISGNLPPFEDAEILRAEGGVEGTVLLEDSGRYRVRYTDNSVYVSKLRATLFIVR